MSGPSLRAKMHPRGARDQPRGTQECPRDAQEAPKSAQEMPKRRPRELGRPPTPSKIEPGKARNASWMRLGAVGEHLADLSSKKAFSAASANEFRSMCSMIAKSVNLDFYRPCRGFRRFFKNARGSIHVGATRKKTLKNALLEPPKPFPDSPGPSKIKPAALRNTKKSTGMGMNGWVGCTSGVCTGSQC